MKKILDVERILTIKVATGKEKDSDEDTGLQISSHVDVDNAVVRDKYTMRDIGIRRYGEFTASRGTLYISKKELLELRALIDEFAQEVGIE